MKYHIFYSLSQQKWLDVLADVKEALVAYPLAYLERNCRGSCKLFFKV